MDTQEQPLNLNEEQKLEQVQEKKKKKNSKNEKLKNKFISFIISKSMSAT